MVLRIAYHRSPALIARTGVGHYTADLMEALCRRDDLRIAPLPAGIVARAYRRMQPLLTPKQPRAGGVSSRRRGSLKSLLRSAYRAAQRAFQWNVSRQLTPRRHDIYHEPNFPVLPSDIPTVLTLHDLSCLLMPEHHPPERVAAYEKQLPRVLSQTTHIISVSEFVRREIIRVLGWPADRVTAIHHGVRPGLGPMPGAEVQATLAALGLPPTYLLHVGTIEPRKNLLLLMKSFCRLPAALRERCPLVLAGGWGWNVREIADYFHDHALHHGVRHLGYLRDEDLGALYNGARALVFPSHYEGFGLPCLEMLACGGAVLASKAGTLQEIFGGNAHTIDAEDADGWTSAMARVIADDDWQTALRSRSLEFAGRFTWNRCAEETHAVYRRVAAA
jgi:alpha-1,3-rhamnosyl/mannosyltransferase